uniref:Uncharacterized protein n=1 Tax=Hyaloperonospora arabidopsidis (strain Emoy2) TaxID=559515 RepID=M4BQJ7_HYAAE
MDAQCRQDPPGACNGWTKTHVPCYVRLVELRAKCELSSWWNVRQWLPQPSSDIIVDELRASQPTIDCSGKGHLFDLLV